MELANIAFNLGRSVAVMAKKIRRKRTKSAKYKQFQNETDGKRTLLEKFLRDAANGQPVDGTRFVNPFRKTTADDKLNLTKCEGGGYCETQEQIGFMFPTEGDGCHGFHEDASKRLQAEDELSIDLIDFRADEAFLASQTSAASIGIREPGDGAETPSRVHFRHCDGADDISASPCIYNRNRMTSDKKHRETPKSRYIVRSGYKSSKKVAPVCVHNAHAPISSKRKADDRQTPRTKCTRKMSRKQIFRRYPSMNTAFLQSESCSNEGSLLLVGTDDSIRAVRGIEHELNYSEEESNIFEKAFVKYGVV